MKTLTLFLISFIFFVSLSSAKAQLADLYYEDFELIESNNYFTISYKVKQDEVYKGKSLDSYVEHKFILTFYIKGHVPSTVNLKAPMTIELELAEGEENKEIEIPIKSIEGGKIQTYRVSLLATETPFIKKLNYKIDYKD